MNLSGSNEEKCELLRSVQLIRNVSFFSDLSPDFCRVLAYLCERQIFSAGQDILKEGEVADTAVIVARGTAQLMHGKQLVEAVERGSCTGVLALLGQFRWLYTLQAESEVECLLLPRHKFLPQFMAQPEALVGVTRKLIGEVVEWERRQLEHPVEMRFHGLGMI